MTTPVPADKDGTPRWGLGDALMGFVLGVILSGILASAWLAAHKGMKDLSLGGQALSQLGLWTGLVSVTVLASKLKGGGTLSADFGFRFKAKDLLTGIVVGAITHEWVVWLVRNGLRPILGHPNISGPAEDLVKTHHGVGLVGVVLFVTVGAPLVEELFFRGLVLRSLERRFGTAAAVVGSAILFGAAHPQPLPGAAIAVVMINLSVFGAILGVLAVKTGRLGPGIVAHAVFNAWTCFFLLR